ncbi:hypothetical protein BDQ17DRAFT_1376575 [Cyathus striatus]|nr:hypothetical protein BDQ17DRAFT_1376575 [Cyathus striatus]
MSNYFNRASNFSINQANFNEFTTIQNGGSGLQWLSQFMARGASHDSKDQYDGSQSCFSA